MKFRLKTVSAATATVLATVIMLSGCGSSSTSSNQSGNGVNSQGVTKVTLWDWGEAKNLVTEFNKTHKNIQIQYKSGMSYNDYVQAMKLSLSSGNGPDIFAIQPGVMERQYQPFETDLGPYAEKAWGSGWENKFYSLGLAQLKLNGEYTSLPEYDSAGGYLWYNKTIFDKYGLKPPTTFDEFVSVCKTLQSKGVTPFIQGAKDSWVDLDVFLALINDIAPGKVYQAQEGKVSWTDPSFVKAMTYWKSMFNDGIMQKGALGLSEYPDADNQWLLGKAAMIFLGTWNNSVMVKDQLQQSIKSAGGKTNGDLPVFLPIPFPSVNGDPGTSHLFGGPDNSLAINTGSKNKDAAWQVLQWIDSKEAQDYVASQGNIPAIKGIQIPDSGLISNEQKVALKQELSDVQNHNDGPRQLSYADIQQALINALEAVASGQQSPQQALEAVQKASETQQR